MTKDDFLREAAIELSHEDWGDKYRKEKRVIPSSNWIYNVHRDLEMRMSGFPRSKSSFSILE